MAITKLNLGTEVQGVFPSTAHPAHTGDATSTVGTVAMTVKALNGVSLAGLATGLLKNTTGTGVPSIAAAGTDYAGVSTANSFSAVQTLTKGYVESVSSSSAPSTGGTISITSPVTLVAPTGAITGMILTSGSTAGQTQTIINNSAFSITFAAVATSHVADGISDVIAANTARTYVWSGSSWFRKG